MIAPVAVGCNCVSGAVTTNVRAARHQRRAIAYDRARAAAPHERAGRRPLLQGRKCSTYSRSPGHRFRRSRVVQIFEAASDRARLPRQESVPALRHALSQTASTLAPSAVRTPSLRRRILRFTTPGRPAAACQVALWRLPRPEFHRLLIRAFRGTPTPCWAAVCLLHHH